MVSSHKAASSGLSNAPTAATRSVLAAPTTGTDSEETQKQHACTEVDNDMVHDTQGFDMEACMNRGRPICVEWDGRTREFVDEFGLCSPEMATSCQRNEEIGQDETAGIRYFGCYRRQLVSAFLMSEQQRSSLLLVSLSPHPFLFKNLRH